MADAAGVFDTWASAGRGESMARGHWPMVVQILNRMRLTPGMECLDVGCGNGYAVRAMGDAVMPDGAVAGLDVAPLMIREAESNPTNPENVVFMTGPADNLPFDDARFDRILSVEAIYYMPDPRAVLQEMFRVLKPGGSAWIMVDYYRENRYSAVWGELIDLPMHYWSEMDYQRLFEEVGFGSVLTERLFNPTPFTDADRRRFQPGWGYERVEDVLDFRTRIGSLLISGIKQL